MIAIKENRQYTITEADAQSFASEGYDIYDDNGNIVRYGVGKTVAYDKYIKLQKINEELQEELIELREQIKKLEKKPRSKKEE